MTTTPESLETPETPDRPADPAAAAVAPDYGVLRWLVAGTFIVILNETIMVNAIPRLMGEFDVEFRSAQWLTSGFMLTMAVVIPITGWFLQRVTTRQALGTAMSIFCAGTLIAAVAPAFEVLLLGRIVQAVGTAVMMPLLMTTLMTIVAPQDRGRVMGNVTLAMSVAPALGPAVSGVILDLGSWRWMFGVVLPIAVLITVAGLSRLQNVGETVAGSLDVLSVLLSAFAFGPLVYGFSQFGGDAETWVPWTCVGVGLVSLVLFVARQLQLQAGRTAQAPLLDLRTVTHRTYLVGLVMLSVSFMAMLGSLVLLPTYLQQVRDLTELQSGLLVMPGGLIMGLLGPQVGKLFDRVGGRPLVIPGSVGVLVALALLTRVAVDSPIAFILGVHVLLCVCLAAVFTPAFTLSLGSLPPMLYSHGSSLLGTLQQVAAAAGAAIIAAVIAARESSLLDDGVLGLEATVGGMRWGFGVGAVLAVIVLGMALLLPGRLPEGAEGPHGGGH